MQRYRVKPGSQVDLGQWDPNDVSALQGGKKAGRKTLLALNERLEILQELLYAEHEHRVLIVLQALDTGGKDGIIRHVFEGVNPQGVKVAGFRKPTPEELDHDTYGAFTRTPLAKAKSSSLTAAITKTCLW